MENIKCPECGNSEKFWKRGYTWRRVTEDGHIVRRKFAMRQCVACGRKFATNIELP